ncbi:MAG: hypothetical protein KGN84_00240 [Acidobacteriota bacterium]|nr:hypothetical protein [Acidobacteriota bacterium]
MQEQSYAKHTKFVMPYHGVLGSVGLLAFIGAVTVLVRAFMHGSGRLTGIVLVLLSFTTYGALLFARIFALKAQDRLIRAEENMRHYVLTGKPLDTRLTVDQCVGLRFASDAEFVALAQRAASEQLTKDAIKRSIKTWKADHDRL